MCLRTGFKPTAKLPPGLYPHQINMAELTLLLVCVVVLDTTMQTSISNFTRWTQVVFLSFV